MKGQLTIQCVINMRKSVASTLRIWRKDRRRVPPEKLARHANGRNGHTREFAAKKRASRRPRRGGRELSAIYFQRGPSEYLNSSIVMRFVAPASLNGAGVVSTTEQSLTPGEKTKGSRGYSTCHESKKQDQWQCRVTIPRLRPLSLSLSPRFFFPSSALSRLSLSFSPRGAHVRPFSRRIQRKY